MRRQFWPSRVIILGLLPAVYPFPTFLLLSFRLYFFGHSHPTLFSESLLPTHQCQCLPHDASMSSRSNVLAAYAKLVRLSKLLPEKEKVKGLKRIREGFRKNTGETDPEKIQAALKSANSSIGYVKMLTPKHLQDRSGTPSDGVTRIVIGNEAQKGRNPMSNWTGSNMDPDSVKRHERTLKRAGFANNRHAKGPAF